MDKRFAEIFAREPYKIIDGDYYYFIPHNENLPDELKQKLEYAAENYVPSAFKINWEKRSHADFNPFVIWHEACGTADGLSEMNGIFRKIAGEGKPFMDIGSSISWGLVPFIAKFNPRIPCMVTDVCEPFMKSARRFLKNNLTDYNISVACFDNHDMPIKDNSLDYITSTNGIAGGDYCGISDAEKQVNEVYRILKPGGCYVTISNSEMYGKFMAAGFQAEFKYSQWHEKFVAAGSPAEIAHYHANTFYVLRKVI
jgi:ubiquinone/menaquinone biosynthesis C-methylase UbiE